jgi:hypothetical protein
MKLDSICSAENKGLTDEQIRKAQIILIDAILQVGINTELAKKLDWVYSVITPQKTNIYVSRV